MLKGSAAEGDDERSCRRVDGGPSWSVLRVSAGPSPSAPLCEPSLLTANLLQINFRMRGTGEKEERKQDFLLMAFWCLLNAEKLLSHISIWKILI